MRESLFVCLQSLGYEIRVSTNISLIFRHVFEDYSSKWGFNYETLLLDVYAKKLKELKRPDCDEKISGIVERLV